MLAPTRPNDESHHLHSDVPDTEPIVTQRAVGTFAAGQSRQGMHKVFIGAPVGSFASASRLASETRRL